ncbi:LysE family translocator [Oscillatoria sp. CS-180]|uniref:LysE family translocator n=1 Tax=Oscillatoria sp. CS-180 TaxID=3021720 RepID=UPI00232C8A1C|nr:LysE family translocator [Oscillatoria sp. CS-180]MDB9524654.1 LysE family translocator [Oscillatoria sp. CS-180]
MPDLITFGVFLSAAIALAITPGPGILYVMTRSLRGGRQEGIASALGTSAGGLFHVVAAALGISIVLAASAIAFAIVKYLGAAYLIYLGVKTLLGQDSSTQVGSFQKTGHNRAFFQGVVVEVLNPKTALFFLAFIPQFINPDGIIFVQFLLLGTISVLLNTAVDFIVILLAGPIGQLLHNSPRLRATQRYATGTGLIALGGYVALTGEQE